MAAKNEPSLGLNYGWAEGEDGWGDGMDANLLKLGALTMPVVLGLVNAPAVTTNGACYLVGASPTGDFAGKAGSVAMRVAGAWTFYTPANGWTAFNLGTATPFRYNGTTWASMVAVSADALAASSATLFATPAGVREFLEQYGITAAFSTAESDLNNAVRGEFFTWSATTTNLPVSGSYGRGFAIASDADNVTQFAVVNGTGAMWIRYKTTGTWGAWTAAGGAGGSALPFFNYTNVGGAQFAAGYSLLQFYTKVEETGITYSAGVITCAAAGLYQFEVEVRINGGGTNAMAVGQQLGLSVELGTGTVSAARQFCGVTDTVRANTILRLVMTERLTANSTRRVFFWNGSTAGTLIAFGGVKVTRLGA